MGGVVVVGVIVVVVVVMDVFMFINVCEECGGGIWEEQGVGGVCDDFLCVQEVVREVNGGFDEQQCG